MNEFEPKIKLVNANTVKDDLGVMKNSSKGPKEIGATPDRVSLSHNIKRSSQSKELKNGQPTVKNALITGRN